MARRRGRKWPWIVVFGAICLTVLFYVGGGWFFSTKIYDRALRSEPYNPASLQSGQILSISGEGNEGEITVVADGEDRDSTTFDDAVVGLVAGEALVIAGPVSQVADDARTRPILDVVGDRPEAGASFGLTRDVWLDPEQAGLESQDVTITTPEGHSFPAWRIRAEEASDSWAVLTHGRGAARSEMLRMGRILHDAGFNLLLITYTGDVAAPPYPDGMNQYGRTEWRELESAVEYVGDQGAERIVLGGASHGGAVTMGFLARSPRSSRVDGVIFDAPASSFRDVIDSAAEFEKLPVVGLALPESLEDVALTLVAWRYSVNYSTVDYSGKVGLLPMPLLMFQGAADETVPPAVNDRFMSAGPGQGNAYVVVPDAGHVLSWNVDPEGYEDAINTFLKGLASAD